MQQSDEHSVVEFKKDVCVAVDTCGFKVNPYKCVDFWIKIGQTQGIKHPLRNVDAVHAAELEDSFWKVSLEYRTDLIFVIAVTTIHGPLDTFYKDSEMSLSCSRYPYGNKLLHFREEDYEF